MNDETIVNLAFEPMFELNSFEAQEETTELRTIMYRYFKERIDQIRENPDLFRIILYEYIKDKRTIKESPRPGMESAITRMLFRSDIKYSEDAKITVSRCISGITMIYLLAMLNTPNDHKFVFNGINGFLPFEQI